MKLFGRWSFDVEVRDPGLKPYINLIPIFTPYTAGRTIKKQFWKSKKNIVERLIGKLMVPGHKGKKHYWSSKRIPGMLPTQYKIIRDAFERIEKKTNKNPIEILVRAIEASAPCEGIATIEYGGVRYPKAADMAPQRRIDLALRWIVQGAFLASRKNKKSMSDALAEELIATANGDPKSNGIVKKTELERQAMGSR
ncbi:MAG: 30S ribosomal protein S7 [Candidatus Nanoarchaeia archaeon]